MSMKKSSRGVFILALAPVIVAAQGAVTLDSDDIYFTTQLAAKPIGGAAPRASTMIAAPTRLCGFQIRGNHRSRANPRAEWDVNIDEINSDSGRIVGVTAGAFDVAGHERKPRPPIVDLTFSIEGDPDAIPARIVGAPNASNGIKAILESESANRLLTAFSDDTHVITIVLKYSGDGSDVLRLRGYHDSRKFGGGKNSLLDECLRGYTPQRGISRPVP
jgi:hypothetical protein